MESNNNVIYDTWNRYSDFYTRSTIALPELNLDQYLPSFLSSGNFYYVVDFCDKKIKYVDPGIAAVLGLDPTSATVDDILGRIHPADVNYVAQTESASVRFMLDQMNKENIKTYYKTSYCLRFKMADGSYELFHNESVYLTKDDSGRIAQVLHIHTNVNHITSVNNYIPSLVDTMGTKKAWPVTLNPEPENLSLNLQFSKREMEIIKLIALGNKSEEIADTLFISLHTVHSHRKNIIRKSGVKTSSELISLCVREGLI